MALKLNGFEQEPDCGDSDISIELTEEDKNYIERLMVERYTFRTTQHRDQFKCILPCHICEKIELSKNPESTNTFLDFIFMEHENDFEFTKEKRQKIIQSLVKDFLQEGTKIEGNPVTVRATGNKIKHISRKSLSVKRAQRYSATPLRLIKAKRILSERRNKIHRIHKPSEIAECSVINKLRSHSSQRKRYKTTYLKTNCSRTKSTPENIRHTVINNLKPDRTCCQTVVKIKVRPNSAIKKDKSHETKTKFDIKQRPLVMKQDGDVKQLHNNTEEPEVKPTSVVRRIQPVNRENKSTTPLCQPNSKIPIKKRLNYNFGGNKTELKVPMKDTGSPFYIKDDCMDVALYQDGLACQGWNPTQVLYEICGYCGWGKPEFLEGGSVLGGFLCCVRVMGFGFMARTRGKTKKIARHLASTRFLNHIGFEFNFSIYSEMPHTSINPYSEERFVHLGESDAQNCYE